MLGVGQFGVGGGLRGLLGLGLMVLGWLCVILGTLVFGLIWTGLYVGGFVWDRWR